MEALVSGALVMSDVMLSIPPDFVDGESIFFYTDTNIDLPNKIRYYLRNEEERLRIARNGWNLAMNRHQSWHPMEELLFGTVRSNARGR
mmetsp:Transcript_15705/g.18127  ORF Transcript_15705/g.18127 Transcript_15705/m.18127 type:complete len:89 (-) Transcript_15705:18-284(-)